MGTGGYFPGSKVAGVCTCEEADHLPPSGAEVKNVWSYTFSAQTSLQGGTQLSTGQLYFYVCTKY
jgi:hypothetical protein